jgi:hypothetical protein
MKTTNELRFTPESFCAGSTRMAHSEPESANPGTHPSDPADGANWESAWIDLGGEG